MLRSLLLVSLCFFIAPGHAASPASTSQSSEHFMVSAANPYAARAGFNILKQGGSAIDAAIAVQMVLTLVEPQSSGIGGGAFALYWTADEARLQTFDGRETAPKAATAELFLEDGKPMNWWDALAGGRAVGVPGVVAMLEKIHQQHGNLPWNKLFDEAIRLSQEGFVVSADLHEEIAKGFNPALGRYEEAWQYFFPEGKPIPAGTLLKNPKLADTLQRIARLGSKGFYLGAIADDIVTTVQQAKDNPGLLTHQDLRSYVSKEREPVCLVYRSYKVCGMPPPTSGGLTLLQILGMLENFDLPSMPAMSSQAMHLFTQASRLAYADRALYMADSDFVDVPIAELLDKTYLQQRALTLNQEKDTGKAGAGKLPDRDKLMPGKSPEQPSTTHFSIVDAKGNALSMTSSIEMSFGSTLMTRGFLLNNQLTDFSFLPENTDKPGELVANRVEGGKRPRSSMSPIMVFDEQDKLVLVIGSPGGSSIISYVAKTLLAVLDWDMDLQLAVNLPHVINKNGRTQLEKGLENSDLAKGLAARGHDIAFTRLNSGLHGIFISPDGMSGAADKRREGVVFKQ